MIASLIRRLILILSVCVFSAPVLAAPLTVADFISSEDFLDAEISPNGRYLATVRRQNDTQFVTVIDLDKPDKPTVSQFGDNLVRPSYLQWANNERLVVHMEIPDRLHDLKKTDQYGEPNTFNTIDTSSRAVSVNLDGSNPIILMEGGKPFYIRHFLPNDKEHVLISSDKHNKAALYKVNLYNGKMALVAEGRERTVRFVSTVNGKPKYRFDWYSVEKAYVIHELMASGEWKEVDKLSLIHLSDPPRPY